jgi:DNA-binding NarL/FixJ family response regulator
MHHRLNLQRGAVVAVETVGRLTAPVDPQRAAALLGAASALRTSANAHREMGDEAAWQDAVETTRAALGEVDFVEAWQNGQALKLSAAINAAEAALAALAPSPPPGERAAETPSGSLGGEYGLTPRELEVLRLVAAGRTNRAIADQLYLSPATVKRHVTNILAKLDVATRAEAISLALRAGLSELEARS